jgi:hypothetical protein
LIPCIPPQERISWNGLRWIRDAGDSLPAQRSIYAVKYLDVIERRKRITIFKLGNLWVFKQFFDNHELFNALRDYYIKISSLRVQVHRARNNALKLLERNGFDYDLVEDLKGYWSSTPNQRNMPVLKNSWPSKRQRPRGYS